MRHVRVGKDGDATMTVFPTRDEKRQLRNEKRCLPAPRTSSDIYRLSMLQYGAPLRVAEQAERLDDRVDVVVCELRQ